MEPTREAARALAYIRAAEQIAARIDDLPTGAAARRIRAVGVIGAGTMGTGIAMNFLTAGTPVLLADTLGEALDRGVATIRSTYEASVRKGRITSQQAVQAIALLTPTLVLEDLVDSDLIIEAAFEDMAVKLALFERLGHLLGPGVMLASNTSFLDIDCMAEASGRPADVLGTHFFSPAHIMKLVEVVRGRWTGGDTLLSVVELARRLGKVPVVCGVGYGFIGNRMLMQRQTQATELLLEGALPEQIDQLHTAFGMPMGPFQMADLAGVDVGWHRDPGRIESIRDALCARNRWGQKTMAGYYDYPEPRRSVPSAVTREILEQFRAVAGNPVRAIDDDEILARTLYTMVNEGAKILEEGIAQRASDIDVVWVYGFGWPANRGGPMYWADQIGLDTVVDGLERYRSRLPSGFVLSPLLRQCAKARQKLDRSEDLITAPE